MADDIELTDHEAMFLSEVCSHPTIVEGRKLYLGGWCGTYDRTMKEIIKHRIGLL